MCGRFTLATAADILQQLFEIDAGPMPALSPRYNIAPTQPVAIVRRSTSSPGREMTLARWGLIPSWAKDAEIGARLINARSETVTEKPAFRNAFAARRCLIPADGFYEWTTENGSRQPYYFRARSGSPFALAGLWERWRSPEGEAVDSCTILTTTASDVVAPVHERMPVVLAPESYPDWLDPDNRDQARLLELLRPGPEGLLLGYRVGRRVGSPANDDPALVTPLP